MLHRHRHATGLRWAVASATVVAMVAGAPSPAGALSPGDLDPSFAGTGYVNDTGWHGQGYVVAVQSDGRIVVGGQVIDGANSDFGLLRYNADGTVDNTFGVGGRVVTDISGIDGITAIRVTADGMIIAGGFFAPVPGASAYGFAIARYHPDGTLDNGFSSGGVATSYFGGSNAVRGMALQSDGKIVAAGDGVLARYDTDGTPDLGFGDGGTAVLDPPMDIESIALQSGGDIVVGGAPLGNYGFLLARFDAHGDKDPTFGGTGYIATSFGPSSEVLRSVVVRADDRIVAVGEYTNTSPTYYDVAIAQYLADGSPDPSFGASGKVMTHLGVGDFPVGAAVQSDGKLVVGAAIATAFTSSSDIGLIRYNLDGTLDPAFGVGGKVVANLGRLEFPDDLALQSDGRIVIGGTSTSSAGREDAVFQVARFVAASDTTPPVVVGVPDRASNVNGWYDDNVIIDWQATDDSGSATDPTDTLASTEGAGVLYSSAASCDTSGNCAAGSVALSIDMTDPTLTCQSSQFLVNEPDAVVTATVADASSGPVTPSVSATVGTSAAGVHTVALTGYDRAGRSATVACAYSVAYRFEGFFQPVDNLPVVNLARAGRTVPLKWRLTDYHSNPVSDPASFANVTSYSTACSASSEPDAVEVYSGSSGLQYMGDGYWQFNWATPTSYAGKCRTVSLNLSDAISGRIAAFQFR